MTGSRNDSGEPIRGRARKGAPALWRDPKRLWRERRVLVILGLAGVVALAAGTLVAYELLKRPADVHNIHVHLQAAEAAKNRRRRR